MDIQLSTKGYRLEEAINLIDSFISDKHPDYIHYLLLKVKLKKQLEEEIKGKNND